jgi:hypothetical protein
MLVLLRTETVELLHNTADGYDGANAIAMVTVRVVLTRSGLLSDAFFRIHLCTVKEYKSCISAEPDLTTC